ncbi:MAG: 23S rRNA (adenine(2503)-C(2))-methyltransferase RlmN [Bacteriovoracaceae bacterium]
MSKKSLYSFSLSELESYLVDNGFSKYNADQIFQWVYKKFCFDPDLWSNISKKLKEHFHQNISLNVPKIIWDACSFDGTRKFLIQFDDKNSVETVLIPARERLTLCISSQVGCAIGCTFCHTGTMGLKRNLKTEEIIGQFLAVSRFMLDNDNSFKNISNIVYMGQGEPLHNFTNVKKSAYLFMEPRALALGQRKITLSTSGLVPQIEKFEEFPPVNVAISLHAAHDDIRSELMPINQIYDLKRLFKAIKRIPLKAHRFITYEYILIDGLNDRIEDVNGLVDLLEKKESKVNIIPFNEYPQSKFKRPSEEKIKWFKNQLLKRGIVTTVRVTKGPDILAACGQLKSEVEKVNLWS